jgi:serine/threonine protein kinase
LVDHLAEDMARRWRGGERRVVEDYLARYPGLAEHPEAAAELIYEELCLRREAGQPQAAADVLRRFPRWREQLRVVLECQQLLEAGPDPLGFPVPGESLGDFRLLAELGRGARGRVFLATQPALADRPVVLKIAPRSGQEHLSLARLQHTHIVPLFSVHDAPARSLRALCMPYFGGATLARLLDLLQGHRPGERTGRHLLEALRQAQAAAPVRIPVEGPACQFLGRSSYTRAVCWMGTCLAEALQYTHERGLVHLDLKPANVLWTADGQPMILDLHLAQGPLPAGAPTPAWLGGTPAYMAPEHRLALAAVREGRPVPAAVDGRADLYSLGLLLCEALGGDLPPAAGAVSWVRRRNPQVTADLADILGKCLADDSDARYADAAALADDLRRHLADLPLRSVTNRTRPHAPALLGPLLALLAGAGLALTWIGHEGRRARTALEAGQEHFERGEHGTARDAWQRGLGIAEGLPWHRDLTEDFRRRLRQAHQAEAARELDRLLEHLRAFSGADGGRRCARALDDLQQALGNGAAPALVYYDRALVRLAQGDRDAALADLRKALEHDPKHRQARRLLESLRTQR